MQLFIANKWTKPHRFFVFLKKWLEKEQGRGSVFGALDLFILCIRKIEELTDVTEPSARICHQVREVMRYVAVRKSLTCQFRKSQASSTIKICQSSGCLRSNVTFWINFTCTGLKSLPKIQVQPMAFHTHYNLEMQSTWEEKVKMITFDGPQFVKPPSEYMVAIGGH